MHRAIWAGDEQTGVCLMRMVEKMDAGDVYAKVEMPIGRDETLSELEERLKRGACTLLKEYLPAYLRGELKGVAQNEAQAVIARNISKEEEQVFFATEEAQEAYNHIRALIDWPMPYGRIDGRRIKLVEARLSKRESLQKPGTVLGFCDGAMEIAVKGGIIRILKLQPEGKNVMSAKAFENGIGRTLIGHCFE